MVAKKRAKKSRPKGCPWWSEGACRAEAAKGAVVYCPRERAAALFPGECCHDPVRAVKEIKAAGVKVSKYGKKLKDPVFVAKLKKEFLTALSRRTRG